MTPYLIKYKLYVCALILHSFFIIVHIFHNIHSTTLLLTIRKKLIFLITYLYIFSRYIYIYFQILFVNIYVLNNVYSSCCVVKMFVICIYPCGCEYLLILITAITLNEVIVT